MVAEESGITAVSRPLGKAPRARNGARGVGLQPVGSVEPSNNPAARIQFVT